MSKEQITVRGYGEVEVVPDKGSFNIDVNVRGLDKDQTYKDAVNAYNNAVDLVKSFGIKEDDILGAKGVSVYDLYNKDGYNSYGGFTVSSHDFNVLSELKSKAATIVGARVSTVSYTISDKKKYYDEAMQKAVDNAKEKASTLAKFASVEIGKVVLINEIGPSYNSFGRGAMLEDSLSSLHMGAAPEETQINPDKQKIGYSVTVSFAIK